MDVFKRVLDYIDNIIKWVAIAAFSTMTIMIVLQVISRYVFKSSLSFSEELARYMFIWSVLLGSAMCLKRRSHVNVEIVMAYAPNIIKKYGGLVANILSLVFYIILVYYGFIVVGVTMNQTSPALGIKMGYVYLSIPLSGIIMFLDGLYITFEDFMKYKNEGKELKV